VRKKRPRGLINRARGLNYGCVKFYWVMVTFTVIAVLVTPPEDGVIEMVEALEDPPAEPLQPATSMNTSMAPAIPSRVRNRRTEGIINSRAIAIMIKSTCRSNAEGGAFKDCGGTMNAEAVMDPAAEAPGAGAALAVATEHELISVAGVQVKDTAPVNPPNPVTSTGNEPVAPLATVMFAAEAEKSHAGADSGIVLTLPPVCVIVRVPATGPGGVAATGLNVTVTTHGVPADAITIGNAPLLQAAVMEVSVNNPGVAAIAEILSGALPLLPIETVPLVDVVSNAPGRVRLLGVRVMLPAEAEPVPESATSIGWPVPSRASKICRVVASAPDIDGVKVTPTVQEVPAGTAPTHVPVVVVAKSAVLPVMFDGAGVKATAEAVLFVIVTNCACVGVPISCVPKAMLVGV
jgi:hypothetical protein